MKRNLLAILTSVLLLCAMLPLGAVGVSAATTGTYNSMTYEIANGEVAITDCVSNVTELIIPAVISGYPVTSIGDRAFYFNDKLTSVNIPDSVTAIGDYAFEYCYSLTSVTIGDGVTAIGDYAFYSCGNSTSAMSVTFGDSVTSIGERAFCCSSLTSVALPDSVTSLSRMAFNNCDALETIYIGRGLSSMGAFAFDDCNVLREIYVAEENPYYTSVDGVLYTKDMTELILYPNRRVCDRYVVPEGVTTIGIDTKSFWCAAVSAIVLPRSLRSIGSSVFFNPNSKESPYYLKDVYYAGNETDRESITGISNDLAAATWHYAADPISDTVGHSVMDTDNGNGLAFRFELAANGVVKNNQNVLDLTNATVNYLGEDCKLIGMGAMLTNVDSVGSGAFTLDAVNGINVLDIPTVYLQGVTDTSCAFATRLIDIPNTALERTIYARPYYVVEVDGEEIVVYGDVDSASCAEYM